jgi:Bacterial membrane protein YfhO
VHVTLDVAADRRPAQAFRTLATANTRRLQLGATWLSIAALLIVVCLSLADGLVGDSVAYERDTAVFYFPLMRWVAQQLHQGTFPLWTPQVFGGYPLFADGEIGLSYPPVVLALLVLPADRAFVFLRLLHLSIAALGTFALARAWGLPRTSAVLAGVVFDLGNFLQAQIHHENIVRTAAWLPLTLALIELALRADARPVRARWIVLAGLTLGMAGLGLHSQMLAIGLLVLAAYGGLRWWAGPLAVDHGRAGDRDRDWLRRLRAVARVCSPVVVLGLALAAVQLVPLVELAGFSSRGAGIPYAESAAYSLTLFGLAQLIFPFVFRGPGNVQWGLWTHWESYLYVGLAPLVLALIALAVVRRREVAGWGIVAAIGTLLALGQYSPLNLHYLLWLLPGLSGLRAPGRFTIVVILALAMLAAYGLAALLEMRVSQQHARRLVRALAIGSLAIVALVIGGHLALQLLPTGVRAAIESIYLSEPRDSYSLTAADVYAGLVWSTDLTNPRVLGALIGVVFVAALLSGRLLERRGVLVRPRLPGWPSLVVGVAALDLLAFAWGIHPRASLGRLSSEPPAMNALRDTAQRGNEPLRVLAAPVLNEVSADRLAPFGLEDANGYSSLQFVWHRDYLRRVLEVDDDLLDLWNIRYVIDPARFGSLPSYGGVDFMPAQSLLHGPAGSADSYETFSLESASPVRELRLVTALVGAVEINQDTPVADLVLRDAAGQVVAQSQLLAGRDTMEWASDAPSAKPFVRHRRVEVAGQIFDGGSSSTPRLLSFATKSLPEPTTGATLSIEAVPTHGELVVYGAAVVHTDGSVQQLFGRTKTKYRLVYSDAEMRVFENTDALPRAFLVDQARWAPSVGASLGEMIGQPFDPRQEVVLAADAAPELRAQFPDATSATATAARDGPVGSATIEAYAADEVRLATDARTPSLLVLADTYYPGWRAFVDGQEQPVVRGDLLFRVVALPAGQHEVVFRFEPTSIRLGLAISLLALVIAIGVLVLTGRAHAQRRTTPGARDSLGSTLTQTSAGGDTH